MMLMVLVLLKCIKVGNRLRVRITQEGYDPEANCSFPKAIRIEGREYLVPSEDIKFNEDSRKKFYFYINKKNITIVDRATEPNMTIYSDESNNECCICLCENKDTVFYPCGHYYCCNECANKLQRSDRPLCPICRADITRIVNRSELR